MSRDCGLASASQQQLKLRYAGAKMWSRLHNVWLTGTGDGDIAWSSFPPLLDEAQLTQINRLDLQIGRNATMIITTSRSSRVHGDLANIKQQIQITAADSNQAKRSQT